MSGILVRSRETVIIPISDKGSRSYRIDDTITKSVFFLSAIYAALYGVIYFGALPKYLFWKPAMQINLRGRWFILPVLLLKSSTNLQSYFREVSLELKPPPTRILYNDAPNKNKEETEHGRIQKLRPKNYRHPPQQLPSTPRRLFQPVWTR